FEERRYGKAWCHVFDLALPAPTLGHRRSREAPSGGSSRCCIPVGSTRPWKRCGRRSSRSIRGRCEMFLRMLCTAVVLLFAILAFCGFGPMPSVWGRVSYGLGFLLIAFLVWRSWRFIVGDFSPPIMDAFARPHVDPGRRKN